MSDQNESQLPSAPAPKPGSIQTTVSGAPLLYGGGGELADYLVDEMVARASWVREQIAEQMYQPQPGPVAWTGRQELVQATVAHFQIDIQQAGTAVDHAVAELWAVDRPDDVTVQKRLSGERVRALVGILRQAIKDGRRETTDKFEPDPNDPTGKHFMRVPMKEKRFSGVDTGHIRMLLELETNWQNLWGLQGKQANTLNVFDKVFNELNARAAAAGEQDAGRSRAGQVKGRGFEQLGPAGKARVMVAMAELEGGAPQGPSERTSRPVAATVRTKKGKAAKMPPAEQGGDDLWEEDE